tara:strand:+ start:139 stop:438 length:300 start_codon:yes stop_codon:yes gene_type:complete
MTNKEKLEEIKRFSFDLYNRVLFKEISVQDAYNRVGKSRWNVTEFKGSGTRGKNKVGLKKEIDSLVKMYKPTLSDMLQEIKRVYPYTFEKEIRKILNEN